jgi:hypothetical protein
MGIQPGLHRICGALLTIQLPEAERRRPEPGAVEIERQIGSVLAGCSRNRSTASARTQIVAHDGAFRGGAGDDCESGVLECGKYADVYRLLLQIRIRLNSGSLGSLRGFHGGRNERCHDALSAIAAAHIETGERPDREFVHSCSNATLVEDRHLGARRELAPSHRKVSVEGEQTRRRAASYDAPKRSFIQRARTLSIRSADPPIHAPAAVRASMLAKQIYEGSPQVRSESAYHEAHVQEMSISRICEETLPLPARCRRSCLSPDVRRT